MTTTGASHEPPADPARDLHAPASSAVHPARAEHRAGVLGLARSMWTAIADAIMPVQCAGCDEWLADGRRLLCERCDVELAKSIALPACERCGRLRSPLSIRLRDCGGCDREHHWNHAGIATLGPYRGLLRRMVVGLKYAGSSRVSRVLGQSLASAIRSKPWAHEVELLIPVPMHPLRLKQRPCDHAAVLADALSRTLRVPVRNAAVRRSLYAISQTRATSVAARFENVAGCFAPTKRPGVEGRVVCIVDNLVVTGATLHEVAKVLRKAGARKIYAAVAARSAPPGEGWADDNAFAAALDAAGREWAIQDSNL